MNVIVLENCRLLRMVLSKILDFELGHNVIFSTDEIKRVLKEIKLKKTDIIFLDSYYLQNKKIKEFKKISPNTKVIVLTPEENEDEQKRTLEAGFDAYCKKDIESEKLSEILNNMFQSNFDYEREEILNTKIEKSDIFEVA